MCPGDLGRLGRLAESLDDGGVCHPAALTHRLQAVPAAALFEALTSVVMMRHRWHQRVADGDGAAVDVGPFQDACLLPIYVLGPGEHDGLAAGR